MTTEDATKQLARIWELGGFSDLAAEIDICKAHSRAWNWKQANAAMAAAYRALGAVAPDVTLTAIHAGEHPVQILCAESQQKEETDCHICGQQILSPQLHPCSL